MQTTMEEQSLILYALLSLILLIFSLNFLFKSKTKRRPNLPPSPVKPLPVIGHLHLIKLPIHRTLQSLSGGAPIISLHLGNRRVYVVSSLQIAEECFTKNDVVLANRPRLILAKHIGYNFTTMVGAPYGDHWRNIRRIGSVEIFSSHRLNNFLSVRKDEIRRLIFRLSSNSLQGFSEVDMRSMLMDLTFNNIMRMIAGKRYYGEDVAGDAEAAQVRELITEAVGSGGAGNAADYLPFLNWFSGYENRVKKLANRMDAFLQGLIDEKRNGKEKGNSMIDHLLSLQESQPEYYTDQIIKGIVLVMILAGTDTSAVTLEWALSNLVNHEDILKKARDEIDNKVGSEHLINESDASNLPYLQNIMSETFRLYPAAPMLVPHMASEDCAVAGFDMPRDTILLVNAWAIHRDPSLWDDPTSFKPERFDKEGEAQKLMTFGLGRRACPGSGLAQRLVGLTLGSLIQCFDWKRVGEDEVDMIEGKGLTMPKATPLHALCKARPIVSKILLESA